MTLDDLPAGPVIEKARYILARTPPWDLYAIRLLEHVIAQNLACIGIGGQTWEHIAADGSVVSQPVNYGENGYGPGVDEILCRRVRS